MRRNLRDMVHQIDLARIILGDPPQPKFVQCAGGRFLIDDGGDMPDVQMVNFQYDKMVLGLFNAGFTPYNVKAGPEIRYDETGQKFPFWPQNGDRIEIYGTRGMMYVARHGGGWQVFEAGNKLVAKDRAVHPDKWHAPNFVDCIRTRKDPNGVIEQGHLGACLEHMANIAYRTGNQRPTRSGFVPGGGKLILARRLDRDEIPAANHLRLHRLHSRAELRPFDLSALFMLSGSSNQRFGTYSPTPLQPISL